MVLVAVFALAFTAFFVHLLRRTYRAGRIYMRPQWIVRSERPRAFWIAWCVYLMSALTTGAVAVVTALAWLLT